MNTAVTLNISASDVRLFAVMGRRMVTGSLPLAPGLVKDGLILQPRVVGAVIKALFESAKVPRERVITCLTGLPFSYRWLSLPRMKPAAQHEAIQRAARREMPLPLEELNLTWQAVGGSRDEEDFFILGVPRKITEAMVRTLAEAGIKPYIMDLKPLALARAARRGDAIIVDLVPDCFDIVIVAGGLPLVMHSVIPRGEGATLEDNVRRLTSELSKTVKFFNASHPRDALSPTTPLLLTGELMADTDTAGELIATATGYPVEPLVPALELSPNLPAALLTANIGLALKKIPPRIGPKSPAQAFRDININILADKREDMAKRIKPPDILLPVALLICLGFLYPVYHLKSQLAADNILAQTELASFQQTLDERLKATDDARRVGDDITETTARTETVIEEHQSILGGAGQYTANLELVTGNLPADAFFTFIEIGNSQINLSGEAASSLTLIDYITALERTGAFTDVRIAVIEDAPGTGTGTSLANLPVAFTIIISR